MSSVRIMKIASSPFALALALGLFFPGAAPLVAQDFVIAEFMAQNGATLEDEDGDTSDWIEVLNAGASTASLAGWYLTNLPSNLTLWQFPAVSLAPGKSLVVFASEKNRIDPAGRLHTNFRLEALGGYLALVQPDGTTKATQYAPFPPQPEDYSYGLSQGANIISVVAAGAPARALIPTSNIGTTWRQVGFDDGGWAAGATGLGYERSSGYESLIGLDVEAQMYNANQTAYLRIPFTLTNAASFQGLTLRMKYDDGFAAFLNGTLIASRNAPGTLAWDSGASAQHDDAVALIYEEIDASQLASALVEGPNMLAIHGLNSGAGSSDFLIVPELDAVNAGELDRSQQLYFVQPTPGRPNPSGYPAVAEKPLISQASRVFTGTLQVAISAASPTATIRYTTNGSEPTESSPEATSTLSFTDSTRLRARAFEPGAAPGPISSESYIALDPALATFTSNIPVLVIDNFSGGNIPSDPLQPAFLAVYEPGAGGRTSFSSAANIASRIGIKRRGSSTAGDPKGSYSMETWDERSVDKNVSLLGMPADSDWVLYAPYSFDLALMRNPFMYRLSNQIGRYAVRTEFCEVYVNTGGGRVNSADYQGVYVFMERIKRGEDRVDVERLTASDVTAPRVTGGYMCKIDRLDPGDGGFSAGGFTLGWVYPNEPNVVPTQETYFAGYINDMVASLTNRDPVNGYARYIDQDAWIDHHLLNVLAKNVDALRLSTYMYKGRNDKYGFGPIWDFDRSINSTDGRDDSPTTWDGTGDGTRYFSYPWWVTLFADPEFTQRYHDRWAELRQTYFSTASMNSLLDSMSGEISEASARNFQKWPLIQASQWPSQVNVMKSWLSQRATWIDGQFLVPPSFSRPAGQVPAGSVLAITSTQPTIYYTLDGTDPRRRGGAVDPAAILYSGTITLEANARVVTRAQTSTGVWTTKRTATFYIEVPRLVISELHFHPLDPSPPDTRDADDFEFLELLNLSGSPMDLEGARLAGAVEFTFPAGAPLDSGERIVVVKSSAAFTARYGGGVRIAGEYSGNLGNGGELVELFGPLGEPIHSFSYSDDWYAETDGLGPSLVILEPAGPLASWDDLLSWAPSSVAGGTPGQDDPGIGGGGGLQRPGDSNQDGILDLSDSLSLLLRLFGGGQPLPCDGASLEDGGNLTVFDLNGDARVDLADAIHGLSYLFKQGSAPAGGITCKRLEGCANECSF
jgi:hypothetical protein